MAFRPAATCCTSPGAHLAPPPPRAGSADSICMLRIGLDIAIGFDVGAAEDQSPIVGSHVMFGVGLLREESLEEL